MVYSSAQSWQGRGNMPVTWKHLRQARKRQRPTLTCGARLAISRHSVNAVSALPAATIMEHRWSPAPGWQCKELFETAVAFAVLHCCIPTLPCH